jgi:hypothetical protein
VQDGRRLRAEGKRPLRHLLLAIALVTLALVSAGDVGAEPLDPKGQDWEGLAQLVSIAQSELGTQRVVATSKLDMRVVGRGDALFLVHPQSSLDVDEISAFMHAGGRVVLLDDYGTGDELLERFGIRRVPMPSRPAQMLRGNPARTRRCATSAAS